MMCLFLYTGVFSRWKTRVYDKLIYIPQYCESSHQHFISPFNAKATFIKGTRTQKSLKTFNNPTMLVFIG